MEPDRLVLGRLLGLRKQLRHDDGRTPGDDGHPRPCGSDAASNAGPVWTGKVGLVETALTLPPRTRKPTTWFALDPMLHGNRLDWPAWTVEIYDARGWLLMSKAFTKLRDDHPATSSSVAITSMRPEALSFLSRGDTSSAV